MIDVYEPPEHLVLHHNHVAENLAGTLVGVITLKDPQQSSLAIELLYDPGSAFEVNYKQNRLYSSCFFASVAKLGPMQKFGSIIFYLVEN